MTYVKGLIAGTVAILMAAALTPIILGVYFLVAYRSGTNEAVGWDPTSCAKEPLLWFIASLVFIAGFLWGFRRDV